jgi:hypothetical protein
MRQAATFAGSKSGLGALRTAGRAGIPAVAFLRTFFVAGFLAGLFMAAFFTAFLTATFLTAFFAVVLLAAFRTAAFLTVFRARVFPAPAGRADRAPLPVAFARTGFFFGPAFARAGRADFLRIRADLAARVRRPAAEASLRFPPAAALRTRAGPAFRLLFFFFAFLADVFRAAPLVFLPVDRAPGRALAFVERFFACRAFFLAVFFTGSPSRHR